MGLRAIVAAVFLAGCAQSGNAGSDAAADVPFITTLLGRYGGGESTTVSMGLGTPLPNTGVDVVVEESDAGGVVLVDGLMGCPIPLVFSSPLQASISSGSPCTAQELGLGFNPPFPRSFRLFVTYRAQSGTVTFAPGLPGRELLSMSILWNVTEMPIDSTGDAGATITGIETETMTGVRVP